MLTTSLIFVLRVLSTWIHTKLNDVFTLRRRYWWGERRTSLRLIILLVISKLNLYRFLFFILDFVDIDIEIETGGRFSSFNQFGISYYDSGSNSLRCLDQFILKINLVLAAIFTIVFVFVK